MITPRRMMLALLMLVALWSTGARADYHVSAYIDAAGYESILTKDYQNAALKSGRAGRLSTDFAVTANACVSQLLLNELDTALAACDKALQRLPNFSRFSVVTTRKHHNEMESVLLSNRGVVLARQGRVVEAERDFARALVLDSTNTNARSNLEQVRVTQLSAIAK